MINFEQISTALHDMVNALSDAQRVHAMAVHAPIVAAALGLVMVLVLTLTGGKFRSLRWFCVALYVIGALTGWLASQAGETAMASFRADQLTAEAKQALEYHEQMGQYLWIGMVVTPLLVALTAVQPTALRVIALLLALLSAVGTAGWVGITAHYGGEMVYVRGVGVPESDNNITKLRLEVTPPPAPETTKTPDVKTDDPNAPKEPPKEPEERRPNIFDFPDKPEKK